MQTLAIVLDKTAHPPVNKASNKVACPLCQGNVSRVRRSLLDRLRGLFVPRGRALYRYHCAASACAWTGSLERRAGGRNLYGAAGSRRHVLDPARMSGFGD